MKEKAAATSVLYLIFYIYMKSLEVKKSRVWESYTGGYTVFAVIQLYSISRLFSTLLVPPT